MFVFFNSFAFGGDASGDNITGGDFENLIGGNGNDILFGASDVNKIEGGAGDDRIDGGAGDDVLIGGGGSNDILSYPQQDNTANVTVTLVMGGKATVSGVGSHAEGDEATGFESLHGGEGDDILTGDAGNNLIEGGVGADTLDGKGGINTLSYGLNDNSGNITINLLARDRRWRCRNRHHRI